MDTLEVLVKARGLLAKPESWIQGGLSETAAGDPVGGARHRPIDHLS